jgi:hypothetical protein
VLHADEPRELRGRADIGRGTVGAVRWLIEPVAEGGSRVTLSAEVERAGLGDRLVLAVGGTRWLERGFHEALAQLGRVA